MVILGNNDMYNVRLTTLIGDYDRDTLTNLYQPIIGYKSLALFFTLWSEANIQKVNPNGTHETLLAKMQISVADFIKSRKALEGVGLLKTFLEENSGIKMYHYELYAPKSPAEFFNDTLLYGLLINYLGEMDAKKLNSYYATAKKVDGKDISASFKEVFHPNFESDAFRKALKSDPAMGRNRASMKLEFNYVDFFEALKQVSQISEKAFTKGELAEIARLASLYGLDVSRAAAIVASCYNPNLEKGKRFDLVAIKKAFQEETNYSYLSSFGGNGFNSKKPNFVSSNGALAQKINILESVSPKDYLSLLQNGTEPALPDLNLLDYLSKKFKLTNPVINVVIDYTLGMNDNVLSKPYCEKICASIARSNIETALDAMNYLKSIGKKKKKVVEEVYGEEKPIQNDTSKKVKEEEKVSDEEWENLLKELESDDDNQGGDDGGKA